MTCKAESTIVLAALALALALALGPGTALAGPMETGKKAHEAASGVVTKVEKAVKQGARKTGEAIERGVKAANRGVDKVGAKAGLPAGSASAAKAAQPAR